MSERRQPKRHGPEQIIAKLREADAMLTGGISWGFCPEAAQFDSR